MKAELMSQEEIINKVFQNPLTITEDDEKKGNCSLCLLRRDIMRCLCINTPNNKEESIWPAAMAICAGIDLLGYYLKTNNIEGREFDPDPDAFKEYCNKFNIVKTLEDATTLYSFRCGLMHKYSINNVYENKKYIFTLDYRKKKTQLIVHKDGTDDYWINLYVLYKKFEESINIYKQALVTTIGLKDAITQKIVILGLVGWDSSNIGTSGSYVKSVIIKK
jgi:hypothetical protein